MAQCSRPGGGVCALAHIGETNRNETNGETWSSVRERTDAAGRAADNLGAYPESPAMKTTFRLPLTLLPLIAGAAVLLFGTAGVAHIDGWPLGVGNGRSARGVIAAPETGIDNPGTQVGAIVAADAPARRRCMECGVIASIREVDGYEEPAIAGLGGHDAMPMVARTYRFTVRLENGSQHEILNTNPSAWRIGERVNVIDGKGSGSR